MMPSGARERMSLDAFLAWERQQPERHEYDGSVAIAVTGNSLAHVQITMNLGFALRHSLRGSGYRPLMSSVKVIAAGSVRYPDIAITGGSTLSMEDIVPEPVLIIEVSSAGTAHVDQVQKKLEYFSTVSIQQYLIVDQDERLADLYTRTENGWINEVITGDAVLTLSSVGVELGLDAIYEDTELDATRQPAAGEPAPAA